MLIPINQETIRIRLDDLIISLNKLKKLSKLDYKKFSDKDFDHLDLAFFHLQKSLEDILSIGAHILSRLERDFSIAEYSSILPDLAKGKIIPQEFADRNKNLGKYRNRLVHGYHNITPDELYQILQNHLTDLQQFGQIINDLLKNPSKFNLTVE